MSGDQAGGWQWVVTSSGVHAFSLRCRGHARQHARAHTHTQTHFVLALSRHCDPLLVSPLPYPVPPYCLSSLSQMMELRIKASQARRKEDSTRTRLRPLLPTWDRLRSDARSDLQPPPAPSSGVYHLHPPRRVLSSLDADGMEGGGVGGRGMAAQTKESARVNLHLGGDTEAGDSESGVRNGDSVCDGAGGGGGAQLGGVTQGDAPSESRFRGGGRPPMA